MKYAQVKFKASYSTYEFITNLELNKGDIVVCDSNNELQVGTVDGVSEQSMNNKKTFKWIVDKVDLCSHNKRMEKEKKMKELKVKLESRRKKIESIQIYRLLAKEDEEMANILKELDDIELN